MKISASILRCAAALLVGIGLCAPVLAQDKTDNWLTRLFQPPATAPVPSAGGAREWSGESGASGHPLMTADAIRAAAADFGNCLERLWPDAARRGVSRENFERYTAGLMPDLRIMDLLDAQPEFTKSPWDYLDALVSEERIARGRELLTQYAGVFDAVERSYGVDRHIVAAIWGVESNYGTMGGDRPAYLLDRDPWPAPAAAAIVSAKSSWPRSRSCNAAISRPSVWSAHGPARSVRRQFMPTSFVALRGLFRP